MINLDIELDYGLYEIWILSWFPAGTVYFQDITNAKYIELGSYDEYKTNYNLIVLY